MCAAHRVSAVHCVPACRPLCRVNTPNHPPPLPPPVLPCRTVRIFGGEALERQRYAGCVAQALASGRALAGARATLEGVNRGAVHASLLALYGLGGE